MTNNIKLLLKDDEELIISRNEEKYINVTEICKYADKNLTYWKRAKTNFDMIKKEPSILVEDDNSNTYAKPEIAIIISEWCSDILGEKLKEFLEKENNDIISTNDENNYDLSSIMINTDKILVLKGVRIIARKSDGYVNLTQLCKAGGKEYKHWNEIKNSKAFLEALSTSVCLTTGELIKYESGSNENRATWGHPQVAINIAQWISAEFNVQVSKWVFEILLTGKIDVSNEKTNKELEDVYKEKIEKLKNDNEQIKLSNQIIMKENITLKKEFTSLHKQHDEILKKRTYHKFKKGSCFYIVKDDWRQQDYFKVGITSNINDRLSDYRTIVPECKILFLVFLENNKILEDCIISKYRKVLTHQNHEYILSVGLDDLILSIKKLLKFLNIENTIEQKLELYNNPYDENNIKIDKNTQKDKTNIENNQEDNENYLNDEKKQNIEEKKDEDYEVDKQNEELVKISEICEKKNEFNCEYCEKNYTSEIGLNSHLRNIHNVDVIDDKYNEYVDKNNKKRCIKCDKIYSSYSKLKRHVNTIHLKSEITNCEYCGIELCSKDSLRHHIKLVHEKANVVKCNKCDKIFSCNGSLTTHIKSVHEKIYVCECNICDKEFSSKIALENHIQNIHENMSDKVKCELCDKDINRSNYDFHKYNIHKIL